MSQKVFCIHCGTDLTQDNQRGLVCQECKEKLRSSRDIVIVAYCFTCGKPYHPLNTSVKHLSCKTGVEGYDRTSGTEYRDKTGEYRLLCTQRAK